MVEFFIPGKKVDIFDIPSMQTNTKFNPSVDVPSQLQAIFTSQELNQVICPIVSESLQHIKVIIRLTSPKKGLVSGARLKHLQMVARELQSPLLTGMSQFKKLCKQFYRFKDNLAANADQSYISECLLDKYKSLNDACLDLACSNTLSSVFEVVSKATLSLLSQYTGVSIIQYENGNVHKLVDNSEAYEQFLTQMTSPKNLSAREIKQ